MPSGIVTRHLLITGLVQGVWYRESLREVADSLGVTGWTRNRLDGSVEAMLQGEAGRMARKKGGGHAGGHGWYVTFADLMGLLMMFFVTLTAFSTMDKQKLV